MGLSHTEVSCAMVWLLCWHALRYSVTIRMDTHADFTPYYIYNYINIIIYIVEFHVRLLGAGVVRAHPYCNAVT